MRPSLHLPAALFLLLLGTATATAQGSGWMQRTLHRVAAVIDTMAVSGIDADYIAVPERPWQAIVRTNVDQTSLRMESGFSAEQLQQWGITEGYMDWQTRIKTPVALSAGFWLGYRGYGFGYTFNLGRHTGTNFTLGATGSSYGINYRRRTFQTDQIDIRLSGADEEGPFSLSSPAETYSPIRFRSHILDGYYLFNGRHFSYAAAYDQSVIQRRSAGSLMAGAMYYHSTVAYDAPANAGYILMMNGVGRVRQWQLSAGAGYAYNWVPLQGLLVSAMAMPMLTFYNRLTVHQYQSPLTMEWLFSDDDDPLDDLDPTTLTDDDLRPSGTRTMHGTPSINVDARLSLTYNWRQFFINAYGQLNQYRFTDSDGVSGRHTDWFVNASLGYRF